MAQQNVIERLFIKNIKQKNIENVVFANLIVMTAVFLITFIPIGKSFCAVLLFLYLKVGLFGFILEQENKNNAGYKNLFIPLKSAFKCFGMLIIKIFLFSFWLILFIIPGVVCLLNYSFTNLIIYECPNLDVKGILMLSKEMTIGYRLKIFYSYVKAFVYTAICTLLVIFVVKFFAIWFVVPTIYYLFFTVFSMVVGMILFGFPTIQLCIVDSYISSKESKLYIFN